MRQKSGEKYHYDETGEKPLKKGKGRPAAMRQHHSSSPQPVPGGKHRDVSSETGSLPLTISTCSFVFMNAKS